ncbi:hypothetical protein [Cognatiyoonia sp. IB215182]|uniref:FliH/SctL family protein n=1 Tax=Cognatiyoonia sp. IB215182 TaxID=3097353 RepID=UPI002A0AF6A3|nr:hypothetical protein [Cognatiyoonia sp. IB215182]MDX8352886.1 hypothetical protein [Cognatiyoonia sp. IB215182]
MTQLLALESFDDIEVADAVESGSFQDGYDEGHAAGLETARAEQAALTEECVQVLNAIDFTYVEARRQMLDALQPFLQDLAEKVLPHCVANGFASQIAALISDAVEQSAGAALTLHVHPAQRSAIAKAAETTAANIMVVSDPNLSPHAAWVENAGSEAFLDMDGLLASIAEILSAINITDDRNADGQ